MRFFLIVLVFSFMTACSSPNKIPDNVLGIDTMKVIVWDLIRAGELAQNNYKDTNSLRIRSTALFQTVFEVYGITKDEFYRSFRYYEERPDKNKVLLDSLSAYTSRARAENFKRRQ